MFIISIILGIDFSFMPGIRATSGSGEAVKIFLLYISECYLLQLKISFKPLAAVQVDSSKQKGGGCPSWLWLKGIH